MNACVSAVKTVFISTAILCCAACAAGAQSKNEDVNAFIARSPIAGLPEGAFSGWTEEQRHTSLTRIGGFCQFLCVDAYGNTVFPNVAAAERAKADVKVCLGACILNHLPKDYPDMEGLKQELRVNYEKAKQLGSKAPWPLPGK